MKSKRDLLITWFLRLALGASFLSAVADRFGLWGAAGSPGVVWGDFGRFVAYTGVLLVSFAIPMVISFGVKAPLDYSVFSASAASFALMARGRQH